MMYTAPLTQDAFMSSNAHPIQVLCIFAAFMLAAVLVFGAWADQYDRPGILDRAFAAVIAPGVSSALSSPVHIVRAIESRPLLRPFLAAPTAVYCEKTNRWRCPTTRRFVKAPI